MKYTQSLILLLFFLSASPVMAKAPGTVSSSSHPAAIMMISVIALLAFVILLLGNVMVSSYEVYKKKKQTGNSKIIAPLLVLTFISTTASAQETTIPVTEWITGLDNTTVIFLLSIIVLELIIIFYMASVFRYFTKIRRASAPVKEKKKRGAWFEKLNRTRTVDARSEKEYNLGHNYDGIEELDNPTPPWWNWGFILSGIFAVVYLWVYFVSHSAPNQIQELEIANAKAEKRIQAYMATSANNIDENNVTLLTSQKDIDDGKKMYIANCAACHLADGSGIVGPNLTDKYWLHGGSVKDVFKTIKYGVPEKGMKSWKEDFTPKQISQLTSYVLSLQGTNPANPKEPQGDLFNEGGVGNDENNE